MTAQDTGSTASNHEIVFWETVRDSNQIEMYRAYVERYPNGHFTALAKIKIKVLSKKGPGAAHAPSKASQVKKAPAPPLPQVAVESVQLRSRSKMLRSGDLREMTQKYNFSLPKRNPDGDFKNAFVDNQDGTITDAATGLLWQAGHSPSKKNRLGAKRYIQKLNYERFAGRTGWRLPTIEELASLVELKPQPPQWLHVNAIFQDPRRRIADIFWSADGKEPAFGATEGGWVINFWPGSIMDAGWCYHDCYTTNYEINAQNYVRAVCSQ